MNVVFDLGGVLIDWRPADLLKEHFPQRAVDDASAHALSRAFFHHQDWLDFDGGLREAEDVAARTAQRLQLPAAAVRDFIVPLGEYLQPLPVTVDTLAGLAELRDEGAPLKLCYLSNMPLPYARALERRLPGLFARFDGGVFSGDVKRIKPNTEIYELLAWRQGLVPGDTLFIDDSVPNVESAMALGWQALHCTSPAALAARLPRMVTQALRL
ncbi:HAD family phosphatase [Pseudacidovorax sp. RU35E]|uniref:HAD family hydrolase n=1 Tax=Pseudacidovorax sp. RU35E TaxID=1907403 RepID=UPI0009542BD0|nr:HAD family phosphatase [Pseudacidovorax sp. RU35E]SIR19132.1 putative hydrolase of the HAD superfamily [Pseudacidovorax sp. RU35E]